MLSDHGRKFASTLEFYTDLPPSRSVVSESGIRPERCIQIRTARKLKDRRGGASHWILQIEPLRRSQDTILFFDVTHAEYVGNYKIRLTFEGGPPAVSFDLSDYPERGTVFSAFFDLDFFSPFYVEHGALLWGHGEIDIAPEQALRIWRRRTLSDTLKSLPTQSKLRRTLPPPALLRQNVRYLLFSRQAIDIKVGVNAYDLFDPRLFRCDDQFARPRNPSVSH